MEAQRLSRKRVEPSGSKHGAPRGRYSLLSHESVSWGNPATELTKQWEQKVRKVNFV